LPRHQAGRSRKELGQPRRGYLLGSKTRQQVAPEPVSPDYDPAAEADPAA